MNKLLLAASVVVVAAASAATPAPAQPVHDPLAEEMVRAIPDPRQIEEIAPVMDRMVGAMLDVEVGPLLDAADPYRRRPDHGMAGRTLGELGRGGDPGFEHRLRSSIYGATSDMSRMMHAFAAAAPGLARSVRQMEDAIGSAMIDYRRSRNDLPPPPEEDWD